MAIGEIPVSDSAVEQALALEAELLEPGNEQAAIDLILPRALGHMDDPGRDIGNIDRPVILAMTPEQMERFKEDFTAPTVTRYERRADHSLSRYAALQLILAADLGVPFGLPDQRDGVVVQDIFPRADLLDRPNSSFGARKDFAFHTDQAYNPDEAEVPGYILLSCVRNLEGAPTTFVHLEDALRELSAETISRLLEADYEFFRGRPEEGLGVRTGPVLTETVDGTEIRLGTDTRGTDPEAEAALESLQGALRATGQDVVLQPGQTLVSPNATTPHARAAFTPAEAPEDRRWLQRVFVKF